MENQETIENVRKESEQIVKTEKTENSSQIETTHADDNAPWRSYMLLFTEKYRKLNAENKFNERISRQCTKFRGPILSNKDYSLPLETFPLNNFNQQFKISLPNQLKSNDKLNEWKNIKCNLEMNTLHYSSTRRIFETETLISDNYDQRELGYARIPTYCPKRMKYSLVDRAVGENSGLVNGDYLMFELISAKGKKIVHTDACLRGLKGMSLLELSPTREREKTWKFCFYQAITVLLTKTQLRYKYAWSGNLDYIYDHAWMLFVHMGPINVKRKQRLNDIVIYNYNYDIELELVDEFQYIFEMSNVNWNFVDNTIKKEKELKRKELMHIPEEMGLKKDSTLKKLLLNKSSKKLEEWFNRLDMQYTNCIIRTTRFCLAFWQDGLFWYLYNPFRCNKFGFWDNDGRSCIMKFCSRESLKCHLIILFFKAYGLNISLEKQQNNDDNENDDKKQENIENDDSKGSPDNNTETNEENVEQEGTKELKQKPRNELIKIQVFKMIFHSCKIHKTKLDEKVVSHSKGQIKIEKELSECPERTNDLKHSCMTDEENLDKNLATEEIENVNWLNTMSITWSRTSNPMTNKTERNSFKKKLMWHQYHVEEENKLFSLWANIHIKDETFSQKNRGKQSYACYVICAGMMMLITPDFWSQQTLNSILVCGDSYYTSSILKADVQSERLKLLNTDCLINYLSEEFKIGHFLFQVKILPAFCGKLYSNHNTCLWSALTKCFLNYHFGILTCENACLGIFKQSDSYYIFDVHSVGPPIFQYGKGTAYLLRTNHFHKFIISLILLISSPECSQFALNPIDILKITDLDNIKCKKKNKNTDFM